MEPDSCTQEVVPVAAGITSFFSIPEHTLFLAGILIALFACLISGSKVAFTHHDKKRFQQLKSRKSITAKAAIKLIEKPEYALAVTLVANSINYLLLTVIWLYCSENLFNHIHPKPLALSLQISIAAAAILLVCELIPKMHAKQRPFFYITIMAAPLFVLNKILKPITFIIARNNQRIENQLNKDQSQLMDELSDAIENPSETLNNERDMLKGIIEFGNIEVSEIMCPRVDMMAIEANETFDQVLKRITTSGYSRIPVYSKTLDQVVGILYIKDLMPHIGKRDFDWVKLIRQPHFVPENKKINELLEELQMQKNHMAIAVDEYGGTSGLVTMEDIIEMIVGDISDEFDDEESNYTKLDDSTYIFKGKTLIPDFCDVFGLDADTFNEQQGESESLAGLILEMKGELPRKNEKFECGNFNFTVDEVDRRRITSIRVEVKNNNEVEDK